ncbi:helix-turn-helix transcriptional regulator [Catellatospora vulcania]|uniref:helix-turn-helix transcriptional regulator n=1 Tax=Catellatospora vulcania TaxID=1460450 RepID=UPI0012D3E0C5|nr:AAA family ATPase [Catellatospora vulcania]
MGASAVGNRAGLRGRGRELARLDRALADARAGVSAVLVLRGEPGIGKTALLEYAAAQAAGFRTTGVMGVESEMTLPYAGLHQLCAPLLGRLPLLPEPQREALSAALGLRQGSPPNRFLVGLAALSLLTQAAEDRPLLCIVDDAQCFDEESMQAIAFAARRLTAEPIAMIFTLRSPGGDQELTDLPGMTVEGLHDTDARALLASAAHVPMEPRIRDRIVAEAHGNPMALLMLPRLIPPTDLAGGLWLAGRRPVADTIEDAFHLRLQQLPPDSRRLVLTAAADPTADANLLWRAAEIQHIPTGAAAPAEASGLVEFDTAVRFQHPLARSAVYRKASAPDRRTAHQALAEATDPHTDPDRRAWHSAQAATRPDETLAAALEDCAFRAQGRGAAATAAAFLRRSAQLTPDPARRADRALAAAQVGIDAGGAVQAHDMLAAAAAGPPDETRQARLERLRARLAFTQQRGDDAPRLLLDAARRLAPLDAALTRDTLLEAFGAALFAGRLNTGPDLPEIARTIRTTPLPASSPQRPVDVLLEALTALTIDGYGSAADRLRQALNRIQHEQRSATPGTDRRWMWLACPVTPEPLAPELWNDEAWHELATGAVTLARDAGALGVLPMALSYEACYRVHTGDLSTAASLADEATAISTAIGSAPMMYPSLLLAAWQGRESQARRLIDAARAEASARGEGRALAIADYATAVLHNGLGRYDAAFTAAAQAGEYEDLGLFGWVLVELIEAATRSGQPDAAAAALEKLTDRTRAAATPWALGMEARSLALTSSGDDAEPHYRQSIRYLSQCRITVHLARARLLYGEWLRRQHRRMHSREQLRTAREMLSRVGADAFAERARKELLATGETARKRDASALSELTGQEAQIARLAREGRTNVEIAAHLFISPRTVEWHLSKVFAKLGVTSRKDLRSAFSAAEPPMSTV